MRRLPDANRYRAPLFTHLMLRMEDGRKNDLAFLYYSKTKNAGLWWSEQSDICLPFEVINRFSLFRMTELHKVLFERSEQREAASTIRNYYCGKYK